MSVSFVILSDFFGTRLNALLGEGISLNEIVSAERNSRRNSSTGIGPNMRPFISSPRRRFRLLAVLSSNPNVCALVSVRVMGVFQAPVPAPFLRNLWPAAEAWEVWEAWIGGGVGEAYLVLCETSTRKAAASPTF